MSRVDELELELLQLEPRQRAALARRLMDSLDDLSDAEYDQLWAEEAEARYAAFKAGKTVSIDGDSVFARAHARSR